MHTLIKNYFIYIVTYSIRLSLMQNMSTEV